MEKLLFDYLCRETELGDTEAGRRQLLTISALVENSYLQQFLSKIIQESETILAIDPSLDPRTILETAARNIVAALDAEAASIRLYEPSGLKMISFGAFAMDDSGRTAAVPVNDSIAGKVVSERKSIAVPSILKDPLYKNKAIVAEKGFHSLLAIPLVIPGFVSGKSDMLGSLQIYYRTEDRQFSPLEIIHAEMLARRVSHVLAKKKILDLYALNTRKEKITDKIFHKLSNRQPIKLREIFMMLIDELGELLPLQGCSLFTVTGGGDRIYLEAAYPVALSYHEPGHTFTVAHHPYFRVAVEGGTGFSDTPTERVSEAYLLIKDPATSELTSEGLRRFALENSIYSILFIPIRVDTIVRHVLTFYARDNKHSFSDDEIELFTFFGKEVMKAAKLEYLGDTLHDFKNPAVAVAGLSARCRRLLDREDLNTVREKLISCMDVIAQESARLQDIALTQTGDPREELVDLGVVAVRRYALNREVIRQNRFDHIRVLTPVVEADLPVLCPPFGLERVIDNLLHNATKAIPAAGGDLSLSCRRCDDSACLEIRNSGTIDPELLRDIELGRMKGRGLYIIHRFVISNHGRMNVHSAGGETVFAISLPLASR